MSTDSRRRLVRRLDIVFFMGLLITSGLAALLFWSEFYDSEETLVVADQPSPTYTATTTKTFTATNTATSTPTETATATFTATLTDTPTETNTHTPNPTDTSTATETFTPTLTNTLTEVPSASFTATNTRLPTFTPTPWPAPIVVPLALASTYAGEPITITGTAQPGDTIQVFDQDEMIGSSEADEAGEWEVAFPEGLSPGEHTLSVVAVGPQGAASQPVPIGFEVANAPTQTATATNTPTLTQTATFTATSTLTITPSATSSAIPPTFTPTQTVTIEPSATPSPIPPTLTLTDTATSTPTFTPTKAATIAPVIEPSATSSATPIPIPPTLPPTDTATSMPTNTPTNTATVVPVIEPSATASPTPSPIPPTLTATETPVPPTETLTPSPIPPSKTPIPPTLTPSLTPPPIETSVLAIQTNVAMVPSSTATATATFTPLVSPSVTRPVIHSPASGETYSPGSIPIWGAAPPGVTLEIQNQNTASVLASVQASSDGTWQTFIELLNVGQVSLVAVVPNGVVSDPVTITIAPPVQPNTGSGPDSDETGRTFTALLALLLSAGGFSAYFAGRLLYLLAHDRMKSG